MNVSEGYSQDRQIRVFVSSTFRDMHEEREELVKRVFPLLRRLCDKRGIVWGEVDLRWGVTDEQKAEGKVLPICLAEIDRCRPYFIGLLGEQYGWIPQEIPKELIDREPWLGEHRERSVTELEILYGVLANPRMTGHGYFYFRDPAYSERFPQGADLSGYVSRDEKSRTKLAALKERIRKSGFPVRESYTDPRTLGTLVLKDFIALIDRLYPEGALPNALDRNAADHEAFAKSRTRVYIGREEYNEQLDRHVQTDGPPLVVLGESGSGKSALLANWALKYRRTHPDQLLVMHFIGASTHSSDWAAMLRRIMGEFKRRHDISESIPDKPDDLRFAFAVWLRKAAAKGRVIVILDALNQLEDRDGAPDLVWLPIEIPANVRLIVSTLPGRSLDDLKKRGWPAISVKPLTVDERRIFIEKYLALSAKCLTPSQAQHVASADAAASPLFLQAFLEELRVFGLPEQLERRIGDCLKACSVGELYEIILARYEEDYERDRPCLVKDALSLLWAARRGLSEAELLDLLGSKDSALRGAVWSPLFLAAESNLINRGGLIGFYHDYFRRAVQHRYLNGEENQREAHLRLAGYFDTEGIDRRKLDELPWQLSRAKAWAQLRKLLVDPPFFEAAWSESRFDVMSFWTSLESNSYKMVEAYQFVLNDPEKIPDLDFILHVADLFAETGHPEGALPLQEFLINVSRNKADPSDLQIGLGRKAGLLYSFGRFDEAQAMYKEKEKICRETGNLDGLEASLGNQALILRDWGMLNESLMQFKEQERICRQIDKKESLATCLGNQGLVHSYLGKPDKAMALYKEEERICRETGDKNGLQRSLNNQGLILYEEGKLNEAMELFKTQEKICREISQMRGLAACLGNQALVLRARGMLREARDLYNAQERICRDTGSRDGLQKALSGQAFILRDLGDSDRALETHREEERICREIGNKESLMRSLGSQAGVYHAMGKLDEAMRLLEEEERICRGTGFKKELAGILGNKALILLDRKRYPEALEVQKEKELICRELGNIKSLVGSLADCSTILALMGKPLEALPLAEEAHRLAMENDMPEQAQLITQNLERLRSEPDRQSIEPPAESYLVPAPHPAADPERAARLNIQFGQELARWKALPWWKRMSVKRPKAPKGI